MPALSRKKPRLTTFALRPGRRIGRRYEVVQLLGRGTEGEVYQLLETDTGIHRAAKIYFPHRDPSHRSTIWYARKLNTLRACPIVLQYHHTEIIQVARQKVRCLISDLAEGLQLEKWVRQHRDRRVPLFKALHVFFQLVRGLEAVHALGEYHADVHSQNILIRPVGIGFDIKLVDFYDWGRTASYKQRQDIYNCVEILHELLGGRKRYTHQPPEVRQVIARMNRKKILKQFPTMTDLRRHLETFEWETKP